MTDASGRESEKLPPIFFLSRTHGPTFSSSRVGLPPEIDRRFWDCGSAPRVLGSRSIFRWLELPRWKILLTTMNQEDVLYLTDPAGLRAIFSGERGDIYDEFPMIVQ